MTEDYLKDTAKLRSNVEAGRSTEAVRASGMTGAVLETQQLVRSSVGTLGHPYNPKI